MNKKEKYQYNRRDFVKTAAKSVLVTSFAITGFPTLPASVFGITTPLAHAANNNAVAEIDFYFLEILDGFLRNAIKTSDSFAVCNFPQGTLLPACITPSGKTYVSVANIRKDMKHILPG